MEVDVTEVNTAEDEDINDSVEDDDKEESFTDADPGSLTPAEQTRYKQMQADYTRKTQALAKERRELEIIRDKADAFDELASRPEFIDFLGKSRNQTDEGSDINGTSDDEVFAKYGDQAQGMRDLVGLITKTVKKELQIELGPITKTMRTNIAKDRMDGLKDYVESEKERTGLDLPDPSIFAPDIERFIKQGLTPEQAYYAAGAFEKIKVRAPLKGGITDKKKSPLSPGTGSRADQQQLVLDTDFVLKQRREGKPLPSFDEIKTLALQKLLKTK